MEHEGERRLLSQPKALHRLTAHNDEVWYVQFSHDGRYLASCSKDNSVIIWDYARLQAGEITADNAVKHKLEGHSNAICVLAWSPQNYFLLSGACDNCVRLWDADSGNCLQTFEKHTDAVVACTWTPDGQFFYTGAEKHIYKWHVIDNQTGESEVIDTFDPQGRVQDLCLSKDGKLLVCCNTKSTIVVFDTDAKEIIRSMHEELYITSCCLTDDSHSLLVAVTSSIVDETAGAIQPELHLWKIATGEMTKTFTGFMQRRYVIRPCFGGLYQMLVACGSEDNHIYIWQQNSAGILYQLQDHSATVNSVAWCPRNQQVLASASDDKTVIIWQFDYSTS